MVMINQPMRLSQKKWLKGSRAFELGEGPDLQVTIRDKNGVNEHHVNLREVKPQPTHMAKRAWMTWIVGVLFTAGAFTLILTGVFSPEYADGRLLGWAFGVPCLCVAILILRKAMMDGYDWLIFHNRYSGSTEIALFFEKPDKKSFNDFVEHLKIRIESAEFPVTPIPKAAATDLVEQLQALASLHSQGMLSLEEFEAAKKKLLGENGRASDMGGFGMSN